MKRSLNVFSSVFVAMALSAPISTLAVEADTNRHNGNNGGKCKFTLAGVPTTVIPPSPLQLTKSDFHAPLRPPWGAERIPNWTSLYTGVGLTPLNNIGSIAIPAGVPALSSGRPTPEGHPLAHPIEINTVGALGLVRDSLLGISIYGPHALSASMLKPTHENGFSMERHLVRIGAEGQRRNSLGPTVIVAVPDQGSWFNSTAQMTTNSQLAQDGLVMIMGIAGGRHEEWVSQGYIPYKIIFFNYLTGQISKEVSFHVFPRTGESEFNPRHFYGSPWVSVGLDENGNSILQDPPEFHPSLLLDSLGMAHIVHEDHHWFFDPSAIESGMIDNGQHQVRLAGYGQAGAGIPRLSSRTLPIVIADGRLLIYPVGNTQLHVYDLNDGRWLGDISPLTYGFLTIGKGARDRFNRSAFGGVSRSQLPEAFRQAGFVSDIPISNGFYDWLGREIGAAPGTIQYIMPVEGHPNQVLVMYQGGGSIEEHTAIIDLSEGLSRLR